MKAVLNTAVNQAAAELAIAQEQAVKDLNEDARQKAMLADDLANKFVSAANEALAQQLELDACTKALRKPAADYGQAQFSLLATPADTTERALAQKELALKQASLDSALTDVETQATEAHRLLNLVQDAWALSIRSSRTGLSEGTLPVIAASAPAYLKEACK